MARYIERPREHLTGLRADLNLSSYDGYTNTELARALNVTERIFGVLKKLSQEERGVGFVDRLARAFERAYTSFWGDSGYTGILAIVGKREFEEAISAPMERPRAIPTNGIPFLDHDDGYVIDHLRDLARPQPGEVDGAYCFDLDGNLYKAGARIVTPGEFGINGTREEIERIKGSRGTKHEAAAFASKHGLIAVALSGEVGTVITLVCGKVVTPYTYISHEARRLRASQEAERLRTSSEEGLRARLSA